ncbi:MAG TPA: DUF5682 family protein [Micromonosporaceae bacterium]
MPEPDSPVLLGVRHHGPGSARAVRRALAAYQPDVVLIEGPPEADDLVALAADEAMRPPVALLAYPAGTKPKTPPRRGAPERAAAAGEPDQVTPSGLRKSVVYWPFAEFSPEWQAIRWAVRHDVPVRFCDLPTAIRFARANRPVKAATPPPGEATPDAEPDGAEPDRAEPDRAEPDHAEPDGADVEEPGGPGPAEAEPGIAEATPERVDPIGMLARAAGYDDPERWWEDFVEHQLPAAGEDELAAALAPFAAIGEAMAAVRSAAPALPAAQQLQEERREAYMRTVLRAATRTHQRVAVVCGAWHVPALTAPLPPASADAKTLRGLARSKVVMTWVPWTHGRLASWQGYGAGVQSPGWYHHLFTTTNHPVSRWLVAVAGVLRGEGLPISSAHVISAVRLAEALATMRGRPLAGLAEVTEAAQAVLCDGDELRLALINRRLVVSERLGAVPELTPSVPLVADLAQTQRRLRLKPSALATDLDLDLRRDIDLERSRLLHRLRLLGIEWGVPAAELGGGRRGKGTFWESWRVSWQPEFAVDLIEASGYGMTVPDAATAKVTELAGSASSLSQVTGLVERCLLADLDAAFPAVLRALDERVALDADVTHLMAALPALARTLRYGDVRGTEVGALRAVTHGLVVRMCVGLPTAMTALDDSAAADVRGHLDEVHAALGLLAEQELLDRWLTTLEQLSRRDDLHGLLAGRLTRLVLDAGRLDSAEAGRRMGLVLTVGTPPARAAAWIEGFLADGGLLLVHDDRLLALVDSWLASIPADTFVEVLPLLRRTFAEFAPPERRAIGERIRERQAGGAGRTGPGGAESGIDHSRAAKVLPVLGLLLGRDPAQLAGELGAGPPQPDEIRPDEIGLDETRPGQMRPGEPEERALAHQPAPAGATNGT